MNGIDEATGVIKGLGIETSESEKSRIEFHQITIKGNLPTPEDFEKYEKVLPGAADRLLTIIENEQKNRNEQMLKALDNEANDVNVSINAGKAGLKLAGQGQAYLTILTLVFFATLGIALLKDYKILAVCVFAVFIWFLVSLGFLRIAPRKQPKGIEQTKKDNETKDHS